MYSAFRGTQRHNMYIWYAALDIFEDFLTRLAFHTYFMLSTFQQTVNSAEDVLTELKSQMFTLHRILCIETTLF